MKRSALAAALALACVSAAVASTEWVRAEVVKVDAERKRVTLKHAPIRMVKMKAMTMSFKVTDVALLAPLKVGEKVRVEVQVVDDDLAVSRIEADR